MADLARIENLFFAQTGMDRRRVEATAAEALAKADDGELFLEYVQSEGLVFDDGKLKTASFNTAQG
ncbi:MAG: metalloprotease TldD, partial [Alphaproteobacteria bacterium]